jgi:predicted nucleic acid-binding protein
MGAIALTVGEKVMLDTSPFIFHIEEVEPYASVLAPVFDGIAIGQYSAVTSVVTLIEVLTKPLREGRVELAQTFHRYLTQGKNLDLVSLTPDMAEQAAVLRARYRFKTPDAIQVATALASGCTTFITNDGQLKRASELRVIVLDEVLQEADSKS